MVRLEQYREIANDDTVVLFIVYLQSFGWGFSI